MLKKQTLTTNLQCTEFFDRSPDAHTILNLEGRIIYINNAAKILLGKLKENITGTKFFLQLPKENRLIFQSRFKKALKTKKTALFEQYFKPSNRWCSIRIIPDKQGAIVCCLEITEQKELQEEFWQSKERLQGLIDSTNDWLWELNINGMYTYSSSQVEKILGYKPEEIVGRSHFDIMPKDEAERCQKIFKEAISKKEPMINYEHVHTRKDRTLVTLESNCNPYFNKKGNLVGYRGIDRDVTERKKAEEALRESEQRYRTLAETAEDAIYIIAKNDTIQYVNPYAAMLFGKEPKMLIGKKRFEFFPLEISDHQKKNLDKVFVSGKPFYVEEKVQFPGKLVWQSTWLAPIKDEKGKVVSVMGLSRDITSMKEAQRELTHAYEIERNIADTLQQSLLPEDIPKIKDLEIKYFYQSSSSQAEVGGDFFDIFRTALGSLGIVVGDVQGKGIDAATETARVKYLLRDRAYYDNKPEDVLAKVNSALIKQKAREFTALSYFLFDPINSRLIASNAGNPYAYCYPKDSFLEVTGVPMAVMPKQKYQATAIDLHRNDIVLIYTDGLVEARRKSEFFGDQRIKHFVKNNANLSLGLLLKELVDRVKKFSGNNLRDDILIVGLRKK